MLEKEKIANLDIVYIDYELESITVEFLPYEIQSFNKIYLHLNEIYEANPNMPAAKFIQAINYVNFTILLLLNGHPMVGYFEYMHDYIIIQNDGVIDDHKLVKDVQFKLIVKIEIKGFDLLRYNKIEGIEIVSIEKNGFIIKMHQSNNEWFLECDFSNMIPTLSKVRNDFLIDFPGLEF